MCFGSRIRFVQRLGGGIFPKLGAIPPQLCLANERLYMGFDFLQKVEIARFVIHSSHHLSKV
jgi:hypothetical protein